ncbi:MAG: tetratricopeptide repeat protein [Flavipsychrobacter sp.]|nr:tetratricopeptide repeat protein [Flavipsychrobacter sp.]
MKETSPAPQQFSIFRFIPIRLAPWLMAILACIIYINSLPNQYALDDILVLSENKYVQRGFAGIPKILSSDMFASYYEDYGVEQMLSGGRYRPLAQVTFAIEHQFFGLSPAVSHTVNMLLYGVLAFVMFSVLLRSFRLNADLVFITTLLFAVHPVHTEVVANIKSRDEIFSLMFLLLSFRYFFNYVDTGRKVQLLFAALVLFLAFLAKEYAYGLLVLLPLAIYIYRQQYSSGRLFTSLLVFAGVAALCTGIRISVVGMSIQEQNDVLNNPYLHASADEALATKIFVLSKYLLLLLFPHPLSSDYSYPQIAFLDFSSPLVWLSMGLYAAIAAYGIYACYQRKFMGFAIMAYLIFLFPVSNLLIDIGATMGERLLFHASFGFCLAAGYLLVRAHERFSLPPAAIVAPVLLIAALGSAKTISRNPDWYDTDTLFLKDVQTVPKSVIANNNAADAVIKKADKEKDPAKRAELLEKGRLYARRAIEPYPEFCNALINMGLVEHLSGRNDSAMKHWLLAKKSLPQSPHFPRLAEFFFNKGMSEGTNDLPQSVQYFKMAIGLDSFKSNYWSNMGGAYFTMQRYDSALYSWQTALRINPQDVEAQRGYNALTQPQPAK